MFLLELHYALEIMFHYSSYEKKGNEIAVTTPGITNTIKKLFTELEEQRVR